MLRIHDIILSDYIMYDEYVTAPRVVFDKFTPTDRNLFGITSRNRRPVASTIKKTCVIA